MRKICKKFTRTQTLEIQLNLEVLSLESILENLRIGIRHAAMISGASRRRILYWTKLGFFKCKKPPYEFSIYEVQRMSVIDQLIDEGFEAQEANSIAKSALSDEIGKDA